MEDCKFNPGDIVMMKSGSPKMTVSFSSADETIVFYYNYEDHKVSSKITLPTVVLELLNN